MTEREFQRIVLSLFKMNGWRTAHFDASVRVIGKERRFVGDQGSAGFPDIVAVRDGRVIFAELKSDKGLVKPRQQEWLDELGMSQEVYVWRPSDLDDIQRLINRKSP